MAAGLTGDQGTFTFSGNTPTFTLTNGTKADIDFWELDEVEHTATPTQPMGWLLPKVISSTAFSGRGRFRVQILDGTSPPLPVVTTIPGTLVLGWKSTTQKITAKAVVFKMTTSANSPARSPAFAIYHFVFAGETSSDTVVVA